MLEGDELRSVREVHAKEQRLRAAGRTSVGRARGVPRRRARRVRSSRGAARAFLSSTSWISRVPRCSGDEPMCRLVNLG